MAYLLACSPSHSFVPSSAVVGSRVVDKARAAAASGKAVVAEDSLVVNSTWVAGSALAAAVRRTWAAADI